MKGGGSFGGMTVERRQQCHSKVQDPKGGRGRGGGGGAHSRPDMGLRKLQDFQEEAEEPK